MLVTGSYDTTVRCWDCRSRNAMPIQTMSHAKDSVSALAASGHQIFVASVDGTVRRPHAT